MTLRRRLSFLATFATIISEVHHHYARTPDLRLSDFALVKWRHVRPFHLRVLAQRIALGQATLATYHQLQCQPTRRLTGQLASQLTRRQRQHQRPHADQINSHHWGGNGTTLIRAATLGNGGNVTQRRAYVPLANPHAMRQSHACLHAPATHAQLAWLQLWRTKLPQQLQMPIVVSLHAPATHAQLARLQS